MSHLPYDQHERAEAIPDVVAADEHPTPVLRQLFNGVFGLLLLLVSGLAVMLLVLWRAP
jgi:hypothetical protein